MWYCPGRFDAFALLTALLDADGGGRWELTPALKTETRRYLGDSGVLETVLSAPEGSLTVTDWLPLGDGLPHGFCRRFSPAPHEMHQQSSLGG